MKKFRVRLTRLIEEECDIYVNAKDKEAAGDVAVSDEAPGIADAIWLRSASEPHTLTVESVEDAEFISRQTEKL